MHPIRSALALAVAIGVATGARAQQAAPTRDLGVVTITGSQPTSLPTQIPATTEGITREQIAQGIHATDSEDALKYFPSLLVRKRYIGDYNHAVLSSRASGTGNSARSAVYADGILLSNFLGNGVSGLSFPPRWGLVTPEEIERVDVMYGPFSAAYPGNSVGAVVDYVTRMPTRFEAHGLAGFSSQPFDLYGTHRTFSAWETAVSAGNRSGAWAWFFDVNHTDSHGQPLTFATRLASTGVPGGAGTAVRGAVPSTNSAGQPWFIVGSGTEYHTVQDHLKGKLAWDIAPTLRATYVVGVWQNRSDSASATYLADAAGHPVTSGAIAIGGVGFGALTGADFPLTRERQEHLMQGLTLKSNTRGVFDWDVTASRYDYGTDTKRQNAGSNPPPAALSGGAGTLADGAGTGWQTLGLRGTWRPPSSAHDVEAGLQQDSFRLAYLTSAVAGNWMTDAAGAALSDVGGSTRLRSAYLQDTWRLAPRWKAVLGAREEWWTAQGFTQVLNAAPAVNVAWPRRSESHLSPKAAVSWQWRENTVLKAALGRAVRFPTVGELYGATSTANAQFINDPDLKPERSWTGELTAEKDLGNGLLRLTYFAENTRDALYAQTTFDAVANRNVSRVQNVGRIRTDGLELASSAVDAWVRGLDLNASITWARSIIEENAGFVTVPGDTIGKWQPNVPRWRAAALAVYRVAANWTASIGARYSGRQYRTLDNSDVNGFAYMGVSPFFVVDARVRWQATRETSFAVGVENVGNATYWNFHPYPQRTYSAEMKVDL